MGVGEESSRLRDSWPRCLGRAPWEERRVVHERLDIEEWIARFPLDEYRDGESICTASDLAKMEQIRREVLRGLREEAVPTDMFVWGKGEPSRPEATKFGGLPYWPGGEEWPRSTAGEPLTFVGQLCFADSRDLVGEVPGEVLVIFGRWGGQPWEPEDPELRFFWRSLGERGCISAAAVPKTEFAAPPLYGVIHRTCDYPNSKKLFRRSYDGALIAVLEGTKIGGVPRWIQRPRKPRGKFLGTLGSLVLRTGDPYPLVNVPDPLQRGQDEELRLPMWGDMGNVYLFLESDGAVNAIVQYY